MPLADMLQTGAFQDEQKLAVISALFSQLRMQAGTASPESSALYNKDLSGLKTRLTLGCSEVPAGHTRP